jgi:hypothetical protein
LEASLFIQSIIISKAFHDLLLLYKSNNHLVSSLGFYKSYSSVNVSLPDLSILVPAVEA